MKVFSRENDIISRFAKGEDLASIGESYGKSKTWVSAQLKQALSRVYLNVSEDIHRAFPREKILPERLSIEKRTKRKGQQEALANMLADPGLSKEQLEKLVPRVSGKFYLRNRGLFDPLEEVVREAGCVLPPSGNLSSSVEELDREGGVVVFSYRGRGKAREIDTRFLVLKLDRGDAVDTLRAKIQGLKPVKGPVIYRSF